MLKSSSFVPAWWLNHPHLQTSWSSLIRRPKPIQHHLERIELPDGDFLDLAWTTPIDDHPQKPTILLLHGLAGGINSTYAKSILNDFQQVGWRPVLMYHRSCSGTPNRTQQSYHPGFIIDIDHVIQLLQNRYPESPLAAVGYSLGGSILLNWLANGREAQQLRTAIAVSVPFELDKAADRMLMGFSRLYQWQMLKSLRFDIHSKFQQISSPIDLSLLPHLKTFWEFDNHITAPLHGFANVIEYYQQASCRQNLHRIAKPTLILHAEDDPFMLPDVIPSEKELSCETVLELSNAGGHVGFVSGKIPGAADYWLNARIMQHLLQFLPKET